MTAHSLRETSTPGVATPAPDMSLCRLLLDRLAEHPDDVYAERKTRSGSFEEIPLRRFAQDVLGVARGLLTHGIEPGDRVGIVGGTRYEWTVADFAALLCGAVTVPIYVTSSPSQVSWIVEDAGVRLLIVETLDHERALTPLLTESETLERIVTIDAGGLDQLTNEGLLGSDEKVIEIAHRSRLDTLASIVYTSGTTGRPKGVELTHGNFLLHVMNGTDDPNFGPVVRGQDRRTLLFLPLSHVFGRFALILCLYSRCVAGFAPDTKTLAADLQAFRPTWLIAVPRVFETFFNTATARAGGGTKGKLFAWATEVAIRVSQAEEAGRVPVALVVQSRVADRLVWGKVRAAMGGAVEYAVSGGAPLSVRLGHYFRGLGITVMEGYGLTEVSAPTTVNRPGLIKIGSVGAPYPGTSVKLAEDDEILVQGPNLFRGYHHDADATAATMRDGWFATGDLGRIDDDGYLFITGRKKEIIVTAGGKNVQPAVLENAVRSHPLVSEIVVVGEGRPFIAALVALDGAMLPTWLESKGLPPLTFDQAVTDDRVRAEIDAEIAKANEAVSRAEGIRKFVILPRQLTEEDGELSASSKVRRPNVLDHFAEQIRSIYG